MALCVVALMAPPTVLAGPGDIYVDHDEYSYNQAMYGAEATLTIKVDGYWQYGQNYYIWSVHTAVFSARPGLGWYFIRTSDVYWSGRALRIDGSTYQQGDWSSTGNTPDAQTLPASGNYYPSSTVRTVQSKGRTDVALYLFWLYQWTKTLTVSFDEVSVFH